MYTHRRRLPRGCHFLLLAAALTAAAPRSLLANTDSWSNGFGGTFNNSGNWLFFQIPGTNDTALFNLAFAYPVTFTSSPTNFGLQVESGAVTFQTDTASHTYTLGAGGALISNAQLSLNSSLLTTTVNGTTQINAGTLGLASGTYNANANITLSGGALQYTGGSFNLGAGVNLTAQSGAAVNFTPGYDLPAGSTFTIQSASHFSSSSYFGIGDTASAIPATLTVDGASSSFTTTNTPYWGSFGGTAVVTLSNNATASVNSNLEIALSNTAGTSGTVNVQSGAQLTVAGFISLAAWGGNANGGLFLTGGTVTQTSGGSLTVGSPSGSGFATLSVSNSSSFSSVFTSSTGGINVYQNGAIDIAIGGTFNANGNISLTGGGIYVDGGQFNLAPGANLTAQNGATVSFAFLIPYNIPGGSTFTIQSGSHLSSDSYIDLNDNGAAGTATLIVDGSGSSFSASTFSIWGDQGGSASVTIRNNATASVMEGIDLARSKVAGTSGTLNVQSGAQLTVAGNINLAFDGGSAVAALNVTDATLLETSGSITLGSAVATGTATLTLNGTSGSSTFTSATGSTFVHKNATININSGTYHANGNITLTGGALTTGAAGTFILAAGKNLTAQNGATVSFAAAYNIPGGSTFTIQSGSHFIGANYIDLNDNGAAGTATLIVDGAGSSFSASGIPYWGDQGGSASVTIRNNATASITSDVEIARSSTPGASGTLNIQSGAQLTVAGNIRLAADGGNAVGAITLTDGTLTQTLGSLTLGSPTGTGTASLTLNGTSGSSAFTSSTGGINVFQNGAININSGTFNANATIANAGAITIGSGGTTGNLTGGLPIANNGTLTLNRSSLLALADAISGNGTVSQMGAGITVLTSPASYSGPTFLVHGTLDFSGGVAHNIGTVSGQAKLQIDAATTLTSDAVNLLLGTWTINGTQIIRSSASGGAYATYVSGHGAAPLSGTSEAAGTNLTFSGGAKIDLRNNALIVETTSFTKASLLATIAGDVRAGVITSSTAASNPAYGIEVVDNAALGATFFGGLPVDPNSIIVTQALLGDANLDGVVNPSDLLVWANHFNDVSQYSVASGDFNLDGVVNPSDLLIWANHFNNSIAGNGVPSVAGGGPMIGSGSTVIATPEPASILALGLGTLLVLPRRRARSSPA